jgi:hypothetical protein
MSIECEEERLQEWYSFKYAEWNDDLTKEALVDELTEDISLWTEL